MKRWGTALIVAVLSCIPIFLNRATGPALLQDTDTLTLLDTIRKIQNPFSWFTSDWPLYNHFYRPFPTLTFELDNRLYGNNAAGYGLTNALLCMLCVLLLAWFLREITDSVPITSAATALFGAWHWSGLNWIYDLIRYGILLVAAGHLLYHAGKFAAKRSLLEVVKAFPSLFRRGSLFMRWLLVLGATFFFLEELSGIHDFAGSTMGWLPGRTALVMTVFCLVAMAAYARYERTSAHRDAAPATAQDVPATKSSVQDSARPKAAWLWAVLAVVAGALAFASYEQAVMLPCALFGVALSLRLRRYRVRWGWQVPFWALIVGYYLVRHAFIPAGTAAYQAQQFRSGPGVYISLFDYLLPAVNELYGTYKGLELGLAMLMTPSVYGSIWGTFRNIAAFVACRRHWVLALTGFALSFFTFLPMAWLHSFGHYHYWPMAMRSLFVVVLAWGTWDLLVSALSPRPRQAPPRPAPAPGSLPRL